MTYWSLNSTYKSQASFSVKHTDLTGEDMEVTVCQTDPQLIHKSLLTN